ncbi:NotI family restriction endonuclease [Anaerolineales bacterium HSG24]|nr:NotI family restriction endonuclease [Anaerolineales bacterium HSG24]
MSNHPLAEIFGFPANNLSITAERYRKNRLCPYNNKVPSCTKDKAKDPLGVCSIYEGEHIAITCPVRFRQGWLIVEDAAKFLFSSSTTWTSLQEIRLNDAQGKSAGNIDFVLVAYDEIGQITNFGSLEVQAVYISGNVRQPFRQYMSDREANQAMIWTATNVRADYLSSSRKRLVPQMLYKGAIMQAWQKKQVVALHRTFYDTLPDLPEAPQHQADIAWLVYDLEFVKPQNLYQLVSYKTVYTQFGAALDRITTPEAGSINSFVKRLQKKLDEKLDNSYPPDAPTLADIINK